MFENAKNLKTTIMGIIAAIIVLASMLWPEKIDQSTGEVIKSSIDTIITGVTALVAALVLIFKAKD